MIALEDELIELLADLAEVDGHDVGSNEIKFFILTTDPKATFNRARPLLERASRLHAITAAYREVNADGYPVIWPEVSQKKFTIA